MLGKDGLLYGATVSGVNGGGAVFAVSRDGQIHRDVLPFRRGQGIAVPLGKLVTDLAGTVYGTSQTGGTGNGMVFKVNADGTGFKVLHSFGGVANDGYNVLAGVALTGGQLFGVTEDDFTTNRAGVIFRVNTDGTGYQILHQFSTNAVSGAAVDGSNPFGGLIVGQDGALYGSTRSGGSTINFPYGPGAVFRITPDGGAYAVLHGFNFGDGYAASAELTQTADGRLFGTTPFGGAVDSGTVFSLNTNGTGFNVVFSFTNYPGAGSSVQPSALTPGPDGAFYGTTAYAGLTNAAFPRGMGQVFRLTPDGSNYTILHTFSGEDGANAQSAVVFDGTGSLYGTTQHGGFYDQGVVFKLSPALAGGLSIVDSVQTPLGFRLTLSGPPFVSFVVQSKSDLPSTGGWATSPVAALDAYGLFQYFDSGATNYPHRFYRLAPPPGGD